MITGAMPRWQQYAHRAPVVVVVLFGVLMWWGFHTSSSRRPHGPNYFATICLIAIGLGLLGSGVWFWKKLIKEFRYDGETFTFNTLADPETQARDLFAIEEVGDWTGRGGPAGFCIKFRDGTKVYLHYGVTNASAAAARIRSDLEAFAPGKIAPRRRPSTRLAAILFVAIAAGCVAALATFRLLDRLPPVISRTEFFFEVDQQHVSKVVVRDRELISGTSSTRGAFRVRTPVDDAMVGTLRSQGVVVEFETSSDLIP